MPVSLPRDVPHRFPQCVNLFPFFAPLEAAFSTLFSLVAPTFARVYPSSLVSEERADHFVATEERICDGLEIVWLRIGFREVEDVLPPLFCRFPHSSPFKEGRAGSLHGFPAPPSGALSIAAVKMSAISFPVTSLCLGPQLIVRVLPNS